MATRKPLVVVSGRKRELPAGDMVARGDVDLGATLAAIADGTLGAFSHRNKIINGRFAVNQSGYVSGAAVDSELYGHDMWKMATAGDTYTYSKTANKTTVTIPAGKVLRTIIEGLNLQSGTYVLSWEGTAQGKIGAGSYGASGVTGSITGGVNTTLEFGPGTVTNVQLETGTEPTAYEDRPYGTELRLCRRHYLRILATAINDTLAESGQWYSATACQCITVFPVEMRVAPTALQQSGTAGDYRLVNATGTGITASAVPTFNAASRRSAFTLFTYGTGGQTPGYFARAAANAVGAYLAWSARL